jgi:transcriptional regulator with XRE-family HTH domain
MRIPSYSNHVKNASSTASTLGFRLHLLRKAHGHTLGDIASDLGVTRQSVGRWEQNRNQPTYAHAQALANQYNVSVSWLLFGDDGSRELAIVSATFKAIVAMLGVDKALDLLAAAES